MTNKFVTHTIAGLFATVTPVQESRQPEHTQGDNHGYNYGNKTGCIHVSSPSSLPRSKSGRAVQWPRSVLIGPR